MKLYKYCKLPSCEHWDNLLTKIQFTQLEYLNDPFEGFLRASTEQQKSIPKIFVASFSKTKPYSFKSKGALKAKNVKGSIYMWSHYANALDGICLEYECKTNDQRFLKISYVEQFNNQKDSCYKFNLWQREKEYRLLSDKVNPQAMNGEKIFVSLDEYGMKLTQIYFGINLINNKNLVHKIKIQKLLKSHPFAIYIQRKHESPQIKVCARKKHDFRIIKLKNESKSFK